MRTALAATTANSSAGQKNAAAIVGYLSLSLSAAGLVGVLSLPEKANADVAAESVLVPAIIRLDGSTKETLEEHNLHLGKITAKREITSKAMVPQLLEVIIQIPSAGSRTKPGESVDLVVKFFMNLPAKDEEAFNGILEKLMNSGAYEKTINALPE